MDTLQVQQDVGCAVERGRKLDDEVKLTGKFIVEHFDKDGKLIGKHELKNGITNQGKNSLLGIMFHADTQITAWYIGIIDNSGWTAEAAGDTLASHSGWNEFTNYTGNRLAWGPGASSGQSITNGTPVSFPITGSGTLKGIFVASVATGTSGTLWSTADFASTVAVTNGDTLKITYTVNA